jgi:hypothetical protein
VRVNAAAVAGSLNLKTYVVRYSYGGEKRRVPLGACASVPHADTIKAAGAILGDVAKGHDPARERKEKALAAQRISGAQAAKLVECDQIEQFYDATSLATKASSRSASSPKLTASRYSRTCGRLR